MDVVIRQAQAKDEKAIADLDHRLWDVVTEVAPRPEPGRQIFRGDVHPEHLLVAELDGVVVGWVRLVKPPLLVSNAHVRQIAGFQVDMPVRGRGIGRALLEAACAKAVAEGARKVTLRVLATNTRARRLYENAGFVIEGILKDEFFLDGRYVDDVLMARFLE